VEDDDDVDLETNLKLFMGARCTGVNLWEQHVRRDLNVFDTVAISNLDVLYLSRLCFAFKCFYSDQLDLHRLDLQFRMSFHDVAVEWLREAAIR